VKGTYGRSASTQKSTGLSSIEESFSVLIFDITLGYEKKELSTHKSMTSLVGCFLREEPAEKIEGQLMHPFSLVQTATKARKYCAATKEEYAIWINYIKKTVGYASLLDYYDLKVCLSKRNQIGKSGKRKVRYCQRRCSQEKWKEGCSQSYEEV
jgi:hypothetical protein